MSDGNPYTPEEQEELRASWDRTISHLSKARALLPDSPNPSEDGGSLAGYEEWIEANELELALDEIEMLGDGNPVPLQFWRHLEDAAREMRLYKHAARYVEIQSNELPNYPLQPTACGGG